MKFFLLTIFSLSIAINSNAQMSANGDGFLINNLSPTSNCYASLSLPNDNSLMNSNQSSFESFELNSNGLNLTSKNQIAANGIPVWFDIRSFIDGGTGNKDDDICTSLNFQDVGVNLTNHPKFGIKVASSVAPSKLEIFLGSGSSIDLTSFSFIPTSSTFTSDLVATIEINEVNKQDTYVIDFSALDATKWGNFAGKNKVQSIGYRSATANAIFNIEQVLLGSVSPLVSANHIVAKSLNVYPNPATDVLTVELDAVAASTVELVDLSGKLVATQSVGAGFNKVQFNVANVNAGLYFLSVRSANGVVTQKVIVK